MEKCEKCGLEHRSLFGETPFSNEICYVTNGIACLLRQLSQRTAERDEARQDCLFQLARAENFEAERDESIKECEEQARLLGISGSREAKLLVERDDWKAEAHRVAECNREFSAKLERIRVALHIFWMDNSRYELSREANDVFGKGGW